MASETTSPRPCACVHCNLSRKPALHDELVAMVERLLYVVDMNVPVGYDPAAEAARALLARAKEGGS